MKFLTQNILLIALALGSGFMLLWPMLKRGSGGAASASPNEAVVLINRGNALVLDVRDPAEFATGHIAGSKNIPLAEVEARLKEIRRYKDKPLLVNCQSGARSAKACELLRKQEFSNVHSLHGGLDAWAQAKLPVVKD